MKLPKRQPKSKPRPRLEKGMAVQHLRDYYWLKQELTDFARELGLASTGQKLALLDRIERHLEGRPERRTGSPSKSLARDSDQPLTLDRRVVNFKSDQKTRDFFKSVIGDGFHFTAHLNQYMRARKNLRYRDLVNEWLAEKKRRQNRDYKPPIMRSGEYNLFIREYFADRRNRGKKFHDAVAAWNEVKKHRGPRRYLRVKPPRTDS
jgi:hypothetical protein